MNSRLQMKKALTNKIKREVSKGKEVSIDDLLYQDYRTKAKRRLKDSVKMLDKMEFELYIGGERGQGKDPNAADVIRRQNQGQLTDAEIDTRWAAHQRIFPGKYNTKNQFIKGDGWEDIEKYAEMQRDELQRKGLPADMYLIYRNIFSPEM